MNSIWKLEILFWLTSAVILCVVLLPIYTGIGAKYPFYLFNTLCILIGFHFIRYIFLMKFSWLSHLNKIKIALIFLCIPVMLYLIDGFNNFQNFREGIGIPSLVEEIEYSKQLSLSSYIIKVNIACCVIAMISTVIMPLRLLQSVWRLRNRGEV